MHIVKTTADIGRLEAAGAVPGDLAQYLHRKLHHICTSVGETSASEFSLGSHGPIGILEGGDRSLAALGLPESLDLLMPEWISRLELASGRCFIVYFVQDNDFVPIVVIPQHIASEAVLLWLEGQPAEEEEPGAENEDERLAEPF